MAGQASVRMAMDDADAAARASLASGAPCSAVQCSCGVSTPRIRNYSAPGVQRAVRAAMCTIEY